MNERDIFMQAPLDAEPKELDAWLDEACQRDAELKRKVLALIEADRQTVGLLDEAPVPEAVQGKGRSGEAPIDQVANYKLLQKIGEGGFGVVFMADQVAPVRRRVALKIIKQGMDTREVIARFEAERQALAMMDHPNIAKVLDAGATESGRPYFAMELVRGTPITSFCDEHKFDYQQRLALFQDVCAAVGHAHQKGIIHRDLKPSNILVGLDGDKPIVKVIDFGVAKATQMQPLTDKTLFTRFEQFIGTPVYISPEQASLSPIDIDTRSDIYSLGVLLYELLTGKPPIDQETLHKAGFDEMRRLIREQEAPKPSTCLSTATSEELQTLAKARHTEPRKLGTFIKGDLDWIVLKALEKDRKRRYDTTNALRQDIERFVNNEVVMATPPSAVYRFQKFARRNKGTLIATSAVALVLVMGIIVSGSQWFRAEGEAEVARRARADSEQRALQLKEQARELEAERNLGRKRLAVLARADQRRARELVEESNERDANAYFARSCQNNPRAEGSYLESVLALNRWRSDALGSAMLTVDQAQGGSFSPDGDRCVVLGLSNGRYRAWLIESASGRVLASYQPGGDEEEVGAARFEANGNLILLVWNRSQKKSQARIWDAGLGEFRCILSEEAEFTRPTFFSPDGSRLLTGIHQGATSCALWDTSSGERIADLTGERPKQFFKNGKRLLTTLDDGIDAILRVREATSGTLLDETRVGTGPVVVDDEGERLVNTSLTEAGIRELESGNRLCYLAQWIATDTTAGPGGNSNIVYADSSVERQVDHNFHREWMTFSPDGTRVVAGRGKEAKVWDVKSGLLLATLDGHVERVGPVCFSPDGMLIATYSMDGFIGIWRASTGVNLSMVKPRGSLPVVFGLQFSPDGQRLLAAGKFLVEISSRQMMTGRQLRPDTKNRDVVAVSPDGTRVATSGNNSLIQIEDAETGVVLEEWPNKTDPDKPFTRYTGFSGDATRLATQHQPDGAIRFWDCASGTLIFDLPGPGAEDNTGFVHLDHDGRRALVRRAGRVELWDVDRGKHLRALEGNRHASFHPNGSLIVSARSDGQNMHVSETESGHILVSAGGGGCLARFGPDGDQMITLAPHDVGVKVIDTESGSVLRTVGSTHCHGAILGSGGLVYMEGTEQKLEVFGPTGLLLARMEFPGRPLRVGPDGNRLFMTDDATLNLIESSPLLETAPDWWPRFLELLGQRHLKDDGVLEQVSIEALTALHDQVLSAVKADRSRAGELARWFLTGAGERPVRPGHSLTEREVADQLITTEASERELWRAYLLDPSHPLIHLALARFEDDAEQADRLVRHSLDRLPPDAELKRRAKAYLDLPRMRSDE